MVRVERDQPSLPVRSTTITPPVVPARAARRSMLARAALSTLYPERSEIEISAASATRMMPSP